MSDAAVTFMDRSREPVGPDQAAARFGFACPVHKGRRCEGLLIAGTTDIPRDPQGRNGGRAQWDFVNQDRARPTFKPSVNCNGCWHGYIRDGRCVSTSGHDEPEPT